MKHKSREVSTKIRNEKGWFWNDSRGWKGGELLKLTSTIGDTAMAGTNFYIDPQWPPSPRVPGRRAPSSSGLEIEDPGGKRFLSPVSLTWYPVSGLMVVKGPSISGFSQAYSLKMTRLEMTFAIVFFLKIQRTDAQHELWRIFQSKTSRTTW